MGVARGWGYRVEMGSDGELVFNRHKVSIMSGSFTSLCLEYNTVLYT